MNQTLDLASLKTSDGEASLPLPLELPNGETLAGTDGQPVTLQIISVDDPRYLKTQRRIIDEQLTKSKRKRGAQMNAAELARQNVRLVAAAVVGWSNNFVVSGEPFAYSAENAERMMEDWPFIREQVDEAINDRARFFKG